MQKRNIIHKICDLNCETLWNEDSAIEDYILSLIKTHRKKGTTIKDNLSRFVGPPRTIRFRTVFTFAETKRIEFLSTARFDETKRGSLRFSRTRWRRGCTLVHRKILTFRDPIPLAPVSCLIALLDNRIPLETRREFSSLWFHSLINHQAKCGI